MTLPPRVFCDTSFLYAPFDPTDQHHDRAVIVLDQAVAAGVSFLATWDIISETVTLLRYRRGFRASLAFLDGVKPRLQLVSYGQPVRSEAEEVFRRHGLHLRLSFCDAISFVVVTTLLDHMPCLAFDRDFRSLGLTVIP